MKARREILVDREQMYALTEDEGSGQLFLEVLCGGVAMENVVLPLTREESDAYQRSGKVVLDDLARRVAKNRRMFSDRVCRD